MAPDGKVTRRGDAKVTLNGAAVEPDYLMSVPGPRGLVTNGREGGTGKGGFGEEGGWQSSAVTPPGADSLLDYDTVINGVRREPNGRVVGAVGNHLIANWRPRGTSATRGLSAIHDLATGVVQATAACDADTTEYDADLPRPTNLAAVRPAVSPNGRYLVKGGAVYDLTTGRGVCTGGESDAKKITLNAVGDDGTAYGVAGDDKPRTPVTVSARTGSAQPLPKAMSTPDAIAQGAGVFVTYAGTDTLRLIVLRPRK